VRIALAHPERSAREALKRALAARANTVVIWTANSEEEIAPMCAKMPPDLLLLDVRLAGQSAVRVKHLVSGDVCAVVMLADDPDSAVAGVYEALGHGALAVAYPPSLSENDDVAGAGQLLNRIDRIAPLIRPRGSAAPSNASGAEAAGRSLSASADAPRGAAAMSGKIIALGASTGGPSALARVLNDLPQPLNAAVLIVQHIEGEFIDGLAQWLGKQTGLAVSLAQRGETPRAGRVYVADGAGHLVYLPSGQLTYLAGSRSDLHVPSVDMLFNSLAENASAGGAALLTGMGSDGAVGLLKLRQRSWFTIAQDEASCAVFGMPRAAVQLGAASRILELSGIGAALAQNTFRP
jgi:two-component system, chemotaxis family, response regulator WspF